MFKLTIKDRQGSVNDLKITELEEYNVMEILKSAGYKMRATCGGMGLCADCLCRIVDPNNSLPNLTEQELETLDNLPEVFLNSRLCCQIKPGDYLDGIFLELSGEDQ